MLIDFTVENFFSIREAQTLSFEPTKDTKLQDYYIIRVPDKNPQKKALPLLKLGVMYGANASGKTLFLAAIGFFRYLLVTSPQDKNKNLQFEPFALDKNKNSKIVANFISQGVKYNYTIIFNKKCIVSEELYIFQNLTSKKSQLVFTRQTNESTQVPIIKFGNTFKIDNQIIKALSINTLWNESVFIGFSRISADIKPLKDIINWLLNYTNNIITPNLSLIEYTTNLISKGIISESEVTKFLKNADFNVCGIKIKKVEEPVHSFTFELKDSIKSENIYHTKGIQESWKLSFKHSSKDENFELPFEAESLGTQRFYSLAGVILNLCKNSVFIAIDELESSLHPDLYKAFVLTFLMNSKNSQLLFTTHNREFLQEKELLRKDALWIANKKEDASTEIYSFADFDSSVIRNTTSWYNAFAVGKLGGVPNPSNDLLFFTEE